MTTTTTQAGERRAYAVPLEVRDVETNAALTEIHGRAVPYNEPTFVGWYEETFRPGALAKSIRESARELPLLLWHDRETFAIGRAIEWHDDDAGLDGVWRLDDSDLAQRAGRQARDGYMTGMSIGFVPIKSHWDVLAEKDYDPENGKLDRCERIEARLVETSLTPTPAYGGAAVALVRSLDMPPEVRAHSRSRRARPGELEKWRGILDGLRP